MAEEEAFLFACTRCYSRHAFEELSPDHHLCKACRQDIGNSERHSDSCQLQLTKCSHCRSEFQQRRKDLLICSKCEHNLKKYGPPSECEWCSLPAAFIGKRCQRCHNSEKKYGPPVICQQCKLMCAFERDDDKKIEGMYLCWLCTLAYKRTLAKATGPKYYVKRKPERIDVTKQYDVESAPLKRFVLPQDLKSMPFSVESVCTNCSKHLVTVTQLREEISNLQRQITLKKKELMIKDLQMAEMRAECIKTETELRNRLKQTQCEHEAQIEALQIKLKNIQKENASLSKSKHRNGSLSAQKNSYHKRGSPMSSTGFLV